MSFDATKKAFESLVQYMQKDAENSATNPKVSEKKLDFQIKQVNTLIEFYDAALARIAELQDDILINQNISLALQDDTKKLQLFCVLHRVDPDMANFYSKDELYEALASGVNFTSPQMVTEDVIPDVTYDEYPTWEQFNEALRSGKIKLDYKAIKQQIQADEYLLPFSSKYAEVQLQVKNNRRRRLNNVSFNTGRQGNNFPA